MLSYKHGYHAGNHADVLKHIILIYLYNLEKKYSKSISYIDTHAGNGVYKYTSKYMDKNKEYKFGIKKIEKYDGQNLLIKNYLRYINNFGKNFYPGSPYIISNISNSKDKLFFFELHTNEYTDLRKNLIKFSNIKIKNSDGFDYINNLSNKLESSFIFIDPSYEIKDDFDKVNDILNKIEEKFIKSKIIIWYPLLEFSENDIFIESIRKKGIGNIINVEIPIKSKEERQGMLGSGLLLINFNNKLIFKNLKLVAKELQFILKETDEVYSAKIRYL